MRVDFQRLRRELESGQGVGRRVGCEAGVPDSKERIRALFATALTRFTRSQGEDRRGSWVAVVAVAALVAGRACCLRSPEPAPAVISSLQITNDGASKRSLVTDGTRVYFSEFLSGHSVLQQVSTSGGETGAVPISLASADIYDFYPGRSELLVKGVAEGTETEGPLWVLPVPAGSLRPVGNILAHAAAWAPDGQHIVYARQSSLYKCDADGSDSRELITVPEFRLRLDFLPMAAACASPSATRNSAHLPCGRFRPTGRICIRSCRAGTNRRKSLAEPGRQTGKYFLFESTRDHSQNIWALREGSSLSQKVVSQIRLRADAINRWTVDVQQSDAEPGWKEAIRNRPATALRSGPIGGQVAAVLHLFSWRVGGRGRYPAQWRMDHLRRASRTHDVAKQNGWKFADSAHVCTDAGAHAALVARWNARSHLWHRLRENRGRSL